MGEQSPVCGSDRRTYQSECLLQWKACKRNWNIVKLKDGPCDSMCPGIELGGFSATGSFRATNKGSCIQDYFRCFKTSLFGGMEKIEVNKCCKIRFNDCIKFVETKPWKFSQ